MGVDIYRKRGLPWDQQPALVDRIDLAGDCWEWTSTKSTSGYGVFIEGKAQHYAHRAIWEALVGPIPEGMTIDHLCRVRHCVNPDHMEVVSNVENVMRGASPHARNARKSHCNYGHPLSGDNLMIKADGYRRCLECHQVRERNRSRKDQ